MKFIKLILFLLVVGLSQRCWANDHPSRVEFELAQAERELLSAQSKVHMLERTLARQQLDTIVSEFQMVQAARVFDHFVCERQVLTDIIRNQPDHAPEAKRILNDILSYITTISDQAES